jgi:2-haloacid dehalogenase/putative hydrolase of the HAD superfamily
VFEALLVDFYGTIVHEDDDVVALICEAISGSMVAPADPRVVGRHWWRVFSESFMGSCGSSFRCQRELEHASLVQTIRHFSATCDAALLSEMMFEHWSSAAAFDDASAFLDQVTLPVVVLSNIDRHDVDAAIAHHGMSFAAVVTSEDAGAYKPHPAMFEAGLRAAGVTDPTKVLHVGDSLVSDVQGANRYGIPVAWLNRTGKPMRGPVRPDHVVADLTELLPLLST